MCEIKKQAFSNIYMYIYDIVDFNINVGLI